MTTRAYKVFRLAVSGMTEKAIAHKLGLNQSTINRDLARMYAKYAGLDHAMRLCRSVHQSERVA